ncbi:tRNA-uridine aminocarboxypropyltransferase [Marinimicrobium alkaliphilum]|uniref:tRNA-uridine aminocarboxypropyltransferase n=1 Tax=Marinimicrobium alkaliphilum TaxID=2202654 RepID=UPI001300AEE0|nr:tRNA-uridine aminocarboxypropyltransferase [Marinimicrobium alkaliphilum]
MSRALCPRCERPAKTCLCDWITSAANKVELLIIQHPLETRQAKNTAALLHLSLAHSEVLVGEAFDPDALAGHLERDGKTSVLLYPGEPEGLDGLGASVSDYALRANPTYSNIGAPCRITPSANPTYSHTGTLFPVGRISPQGVIRQPASNPNTGTPSPVGRISPEGVIRQDAAHLRLVVLDATWRKSRKLLHLNPALGRLPRLSLEHTPPSRYRIRKAHQPNQLSTLEASCYALSLLEQGAVDYTPLLDRFEDYMARLAGFGFGGASET